MNPLSHRDLRGALRFLAACDAAAGLQTFALSISSALPALIPADVTVFALADLRVGHADYVWRAGETVEAPLGK
jgi:hypothetical protein